MNAGAARTRVAIPLHRSRPWLDNVVANVHRLAGRAAVTISDATGEDDSLALLQRDLASVAGVEWLGPRSIAPGWVSHCNDLLERSTEEYFAWLPHDDEVEIDWVIQAEARLDALPEAVLALGTVEPVDEPGVTMGGTRIEPFSPFSDSDVSARVQHALEECLVGDASLLGAAFRGVMRRTLAAPLPRTRDDGEWSDILWAMRMLTRGPFVAIPSTYRKRWHPASAHASWGDARRRPELRTGWLPEALDDLEEVERDFLLAAAWTAEAIVLRDQVLAAGSGAEAQIRAEFEHSRSWRITKPLRRLSSLAESSRPKQDK